MIPIYTNEEFNKAKSREKLPLRCKNCDKTFFVLKHHIQKSIRGNNLSSKRDFCNHHCHRLFENPPIFVHCDQCGKSLKKTQAEINSTKHNFCSKSCSCTYHNQHKIKGTRCSKLEKWLAIKLVEIYPNLEFHFNRKDTIKSELDIYIPSLKLAFELNGIFHYEPIFSKDKLDKTQNNDERKIIACYEKQIELCIIDVSKQKYFKEQTCLPFLKIIQDILSIRFSRIENNPIDEAT